MSDTYPILRATTASGLPLTLRAPASRDIEAIRLACTDPDARAWTLIPLNFDQERAAGFVARATDWWEAGEGVRWVIADGHDAFVGLLDLRVKSDDPEVGEVFFIGAPYARGRGYMSAAVRAAAVWAIRDHGLARVEWQALVGNEGSKRVADRAGFRPEGVRRQACNQRGIRYDAWMASLVRSDLG